MLCKCVSKHAQTRALSALGHICLGLVPGSQSAKEQGLGLCKAATSVLGYPDALRQATEPGTDPCTATAPRSRRLFFSQNSRDIPNVPSATITDSLRMKTITLF